MREIPQFAWRGLTLAIGLGGFAVLLAAAEFFALDCGVLGIDEDLIRACAHFGAYGSLALLLCFALGRRHALAWAITLVLAGLEESHQMFVPGRYCSIGDWMIDLAGITGFLLVSAHAVPRCRELAHALRQTKTATSPS